ncbi:MAG: 30S ribosomal protein S8e [Thermoplasmata archaeon]
MALWQGKSRRKSSGGVLRPFRKKRRYELGREKEYATLGEERRKVIRVLGDNLKARILRAEWANLVDPKMGKTEKVKILSVKNNPANPHFVTRNIITKGATIQTERGLAKVTSRPGQMGAVDAVLVEQAED